MTSSTPPQPTKTPTANGLFSRLATASVAAHVADQLLLALLPLLLALSKATPREISLVVAAQAGAWLLVSLPVGVYADRVARVRIIALGALAIIVGAGTIATLLWYAAPNLAGLAVATFLISAGVVMTVLPVFALMPSAVSTDQLARANATIEFGRAAAAIIAPSLAAALVVREASLIAVGLAAIAGASVWSVTRGLPPDQPAATTPTPLLQSIREGAVFVAREPILRAIALCALFWNAAFFALIAVFVPYGLDTLGLTPEQIGWVWSVYGVGLILGALAAPPLIRALPTWVMFVFGPLSAFVGVTAMVWLAPRYGMPALMAGFFSLGFGPMTWLVLQTSVRQILTPPALLGRVAATITTTIYGIRPLGALIAGAVATAYSVQMAMALSALLFAGSGLAMMLSPAARLRHMPTAPSAG